MSKKSISFERRVGILKGLAEEAIFFIDDRLVIEKIQSICSELIEFWGIAYDVYSPEDTEILNNLEIMIQNIEYRDDNVNRSKTNNKTIHTATLKRTPSRSNTQLSKALNHKKLETTERYLHESELLQKTSMNDDQSESSLKAIILLIGD